MKPCFCDQEGLACGVAPGVCPHTVHVHMRRLKRKILGLQ